MKLKRIAAMLTAAVMAVSLAACGGNTGTNTESSQNPQENAEAQAVHLNLRRAGALSIFTPSSPRRYPPPVTTLPTISPASMTPCLSTIPRARSWACWPKIGP